MIDAPDNDKKEIIEALDYAVMKYGFDYADTYRATPIEQCMEEHVKKQSCCGCYEDKLVCSSGNEYYIGLNWGH